MSESGESKRLGDVTVGEAKRAVIYAALIALALFLFVRLLGEVLVALLLGAVAAAYLLPVQEWLERRLRARAGSALITIALIVVPLAATAGTRCRATPRRCRTRRGASTSSRASASRSPLTSRSRTRAPSSRTPSA